LQDIAKFNQQHFFGLEFFNQVINEYIVNVHEATRVVLQSKSASEWYQYLALYDRWPEYRAHPDAKDFFAIENQVRALL
jgi:hypothetical protein